MNQGSIKLGFNWKLQNWKFKEFLENAGFIDIVETHYQWPTNAWPKGRHNKLLGQVCVCVSFEEPLKTFKHFLYKILSDLVVLTFEFVVV